ncbi:hypothetical protein NEFER03_1998 [Nematocida sp. LUAm3]|nr:hypothetical protein NEFER03_1998 [Nematocida sp. LUAm3]KAI5176082.1 hypothetical protein NEFER02_1916 [Nematocida sp. LUAm2]KAI5177126.1 hypothetical protein NEFER01_0401 [Nematocida sp. LUAm1]
MKKDKEFDWFEETAEFGFNEQDHIPAQADWLKNFSQKLIPRCLGIMSFFFCLSLLFFFFPHNLRVVHGVNIQHVFYLIIFLFLFLAIFTGIIRILFIVLRDHLPDNRLLHNKKLQLDIIFGIWIFFFLPVGYHLRKRAAWATKLLERMFLSGIITLVVLVCKNVGISMFRTYFLTNALKDKVKEIEVKDRIIETMQEYCYNETEEEPEQSVISCFLLGGCLTDADDSGNIEGTNANNREVQSVIGDLFRVSIFQKKSLTQHEVRALAKDTFNKCSSDGEVVTFNEFCNIFPSPQVAIQAFLYFAIDNSKAVTKKEMRDSLTRFHYEKKNLQQTYNSLVNFIQVMDTLATILFILPLIFIYLLILGLPIRQFVTFSLSSAILLNFLISGVAKDLYLNASFALSHPFDIGDEVVIDKIDYVIHNFSLYKTEVLEQSGGKITFLNKNLWNKSMVNMSRAPKKLIHISFQLNSTITPVEFKLLKKNLLLYLREQSDVFYESFTIQSQAESVCKIEKMDCVLIVRYKFTNTRMNKLELKIQLVQVLNSFLSNIADTKEQINKEQEKLEEESKVA